MSDDHKRILSAEFNEMHDHMTNVHREVDDLEDPIATDLAEKMENGLFGPMRKLRLHLDIPYNPEDVE